MLENKTRESWSWNENTFKSYNPLLSIDYQNSYFSLITHQAVKKLFLVVWFLFAFGIISFINALFIRIALKCSALMIFPMIDLQNRFSQRQIGPAQQRLIY